jgi:hypothetical protein
MVAAAPPCKALLLPTRVSFTDNRSHRLTGKLAVEKAQQFGIGGSGGFVIGFGPVTVARIPVAIGVLPQSVLLNISPVIVCVLFNVSFRILKTKPTMVAFCGMTTVCRLKSADAVPSPIKSLLPIDVSELK